VKTRRDDEDQDYAGEFDGDFGDGGAGDREGPDGQAWARMREHDRDAPTAPPWDSSSVALRQVPDAVVLIREGAIAAAGDYQAVLELEQTLNEYNPDRFAVDSLNALKEARRWDGLILPGLVDIHCHGGGGQSFPDAVSVEQAMVAVMEHRRHGTTSLVASLVTDAPETLTRQAALLSQLYVAGELAGIHLEGPFLSKDRAGAQDPAKMQMPNPRLVRRVAKAARGGFAVMTLAPELPGILPTDAAGAGDGAGDGGTASGAENVIRALAEAGAVPSFGHTVCTAEEMGLAVGAADAELARAGARFGRMATATHLFNGMPPVHHRRPGPALEALAQAARGAMVVELIADGVHLDPRTVLDVFAMVGPASVALVTDAMAAAGMPDGQYQLGPAAVTVAGGVARLTEGDSIAGGTAHLIDVVRSAWRDSGVALEDAVAAASLVPARVLGRSLEFGSLAPGRAADLVLADSDLVPVEVYRRGARV
jgi:N-acetylglucosamine-6-phosphate deacetylase